MTLTPLLRFFLWKNFPFFHLFQLLSNFSRYFLSNLLLSHLYSNFCYVNSGFCRVTHGGPGMAQLSLGLQNKRNVINCPFLLSHFHYSFSFNFFSCSIYSVVKYMLHHVTEGVTPSHQRSRHMSCHTSFGWERRILGAQTIRNMYK